MILLLAAIPTAAILIAWLLTKKELDQLLGDLTHTQQPPTPPTPLKKPAPTPPKHTRAAS